MDFLEYLNLQSQQGTFVHYYRCLPTSLLNRENIDEDSNFVYIPPSALDRLFDLGLPSPYSFQLQNPGTGQITHSGVLEFVAEEGFIYMPSRMMARLGLEQNDLVLMRSTPLPKATFLKLQAHSKDFLDVSHPKELLEFNFKKKFQCLTAGETIAVMEGEKRYYFDVLETRPANAVRTIEIDCEVDFAPPLDYVEPTPAAPAPVVAQGNVDVEAPRFTGVAARMDGKPVEQPPSAPVPAARQGDQPVKFTGVAARMDGKPVELPPPAPSPAAAIAAARGAQKRKIQFGGASTAAGSGAGTGVSKGKQGGDGGSGKEQDKRFAGTQYSLKD